MLLLLLLRHLRLLLMLLLLQHLLLHLLLHLQLHLMLLLGGELVLSELLFGGELRLLGVQGGCVLALHQFLLGKLLLHS